MNKDIKICIGILNTILCLIDVSLFIMALLYCNCIINQQQALAYLLIIIILFIIVLVPHNKVKSIQDKRK